MCEQNCGDTQAAVAALQDSARIEPIQVDAYVALASIYEAMRRPELAAEQRRNAQLIQDYWQTLRSTTK
jgi:Tfp pilus assembly protein PilF